MKKKMIYEAPATEQMEILFEKDFLDGSVNGVRSSYGDAIEDTWGD